MSRTRHRLDLLPLLDVFMVVLFVFATMQEQQLDETTRDAAAMAAERDDAVAALHEREAALQAAQAALADDAELQAARAELEAIRTRNRELQEAIDELRTESKTALEAAGGGDDAVRRQSVLTKLLDRYSVFELEISGAVDDAGAVVNRCCYRTDPMAATWTSCGDVPTQAVARTTWWDEGGGGLTAALRKTKGGNAMTVIRQDERASYRIAARVEELLRERFGEQQIYDEGVTLAEIHCGD